MEFSAHRIDGSQIDFFTLKKAGGKSSSPFEVVSEHRTPPRGTLHAAVVSQSQVSPPATAAPVPEVEEETDRTIERASWLPYIVGGLGFLMLLGLFVHDRLWGRHRAR